MLQNATPLTKSMPWPPNISDEHLLSRACQKCIFADVLQMSHACKQTFLKLRQNLHVLLTFGMVQNPLRLPLKTTFEPSKVVWACGVFNVLTWTCASRHNGVHFSDISTSKSAPSMLCFIRSDFETCFAPQRRAIVHISSGQTAPHPPLWRAYFSTLRSTNPWQNSEPRLFYVFARLHLLSSDSFSSLIFSLLILLLFSSLTLPTSAFPSVHIVGSLTSKHPSININTASSDPFNCTQHTFFLQVGLSRSPSWAESVRPHKGPCWVSARSCWGGGGSTKTNTWANPPALPWEGTLHVGAIHLISYSVSVVTSDMRIIHQTRSTALSTLSFCRLACLEALLPIFKYLRDELFNNHICSFWNVHGIGKGELMSFLEGGSAILLFDGALINQRGAQLGLPFTQPLCLVTW